jgi:hypothetical protein
MRSERREKRNRQRRQVLSVNDDYNNNEGDSPVVDQDKRFAALLSKNEDELLNFVAQVNKVYQEKLRRPAPFMTFVLCGMQSAGKSTIMERFMNAVVNIVHEGTGTRCPLDTTCIHDETCDKPVCELSGSELDGGGVNLSVNQVFQLIIAHNKKLGDEDRFGESLYLVYRAKNVQNMRFVDTPGIISNKSTGRDNRKDIKHILVTELRKPNTKLCVLLEPKEFATNPIIDFLDESFGGRVNWINNSTFLMTKFDKQLEDSRAASKANAFFREFHQNACFPFLVITPTLPKENLPSAELYEARKALLTEANVRELSRFQDWHDCHTQYHNEHGDEPLDPKICENIGFSTAKKKMREIMLEDTVKRLPEVITTLRAQLDDCREELSTLQETQRFTNPHEVKRIVQEMLYIIIKRLHSYLDGDLESARRFPEKLQTLYDEIDDEEDSDWERKVLNFHSEKEAKWRDKIADLEGAYPPELQANAKFLGGKQVQRAVEFFRLMMIESLPDPFSLRQHVANGAGYLSGGLQHENWERATVQITSVLMKDMSHPGVNYLVKHIGNIFRRMFQVALEDIKKGTELSLTFKLLPPHIDRILTAEYEEMLWELMVNAADKIHCSMEPMFSTIDPSIPTFHTLPTKNTSPDIPLYMRQHDGNFIPVPSEEKKIERSLMEWATQKLDALVNGSGTQAKEFLRKERRQRAVKKSAFLPDERTTMITSEEIDIILKRSFEYIVALMEFNLIILRFQVNHYMYVGYKTYLDTRFVQSTGQINWEAFIQPDPLVSKRIEELKEQIESISDSLKTVQKISTQI